MYVQTLKRFRLTAPYQNSAIFPFGSQIKRIYKKYKIAQHSFGVNTPKMMERSNIHFFNISQYRNIQFFYIICRNIKE